MTFLGLSKKKAELLEYEIVSNSARLKLTRLIRATAYSEHSEIQIIRQNLFINIARNVLGLPLYVLEPVEEGYFFPSEHAWHNGEFELLMRRPNTRELVEILADYIQQNLLDVSDVNRAFKEDGSGVSFKLDEAFDERTVAVKIPAAAQIDKIEDSDEHPNIRKLVNRMDRAMTHGDFPNVLHASASIFETLAKDVVNLETLDNQTLGSFFDRYRKDSNLPDPILDYILDIYKRRSIEPLAGHGSRKSPDLGEVEAVSLAEMTKAFIRIERRLAVQQIEIITRSEPEDEDAQQLVERGHRVKKASDKVENTEL